MARTLRATARMLDQLHGTSTTPHQTPHPQDPRATDPATSYYYQGAVEGHGWRDQTVGRKER